MSYQDFSTFCAKAIAGIGKLPDTVADRSIPIVLRRRTNSEPVSRFRRRTAEGLARPLRERLVAWAESAHRLCNAEPVALISLNDRAAEVWEALFAIAEAAGGSWSARAVRSAIDLSGEFQEAEPVVELLQDIREFLDSYAHDFVPTSYIVEALIAREDRPWSTWRRGEKPLTARGLATLLGPLDIHPLQGTNPTGGIQARGYRREAFADAFARYPGSQVSTRQSPNADGLNSTSDIRHDPVDAISKRKAADGPTAEGFDGLTDATYRDGGAPLTPCAGCDSADCPWCDRPDRDL